MRKPDKESEKIAKFICDFAKENFISVYNEKTGKGLLRHIVIKVGIKTNEIMCILVINGKQINNEEKLVKELTNKFSNIKTIVKNINQKNTNVILGKENNKSWNTKMPKCSLANLKLARSNN